MSAGHCCPRQHSSRHAGRGAGATGPRDRRNPSNTSVNLRHGTWVSSPVNGSVQCLGRVPSCAGVSCLQLPYWPELEPSAEWALYQSCSAILRKATRTAGVGHQQKGRPCALEQWQSHAECKPTTALVSGCFNMALFRGRRLMAIISMLPCTFHS